MTREADTALLNPIALFERHALLEPAALGDLADPVAGPDLARAVLRAGREVEGEEELRLAPELDPRSWSSLIDPRRVARHVTRSPRAPSNRERDALNGVR